MTNLKKETKEKVDFDLDVMKTFLEIILDRLDIVAAVAATNPKVGESILQNKDSAKAKENLKEENFEEIFSKLKSLAPKQLVAEYNDHSTSILPKVNRQEFIRKFGIIE